MRRRTDWTQPVSSRLCLPGSEQQLERRIRARLELKLSGIEIEWTGRVPRPPLPQIVGGPQIRVPTPIAYAECSRTEVLANHSRHHVCGGRDAERLLVSVLHCLPVPRTSNRNGLLGIFFYRQSFAKARARESSPGVSLAATQSRLVIASCRSSSPEGGSPAAARLNHRCAATRSRSTPFPDVLR